MSVSIKYSIFFFIFICSTLCFSEDYKLRITDAINSGRFSSIAKPASKATLSTLFPKIKSDESLYQFIRLMLQQSINKYSASEEFDFETVYEREINLKISEVLLFNNLNNTYVKFLINISEDTIWLLDIENVISEFSIVKIAEDILALFPTTEESLTTFALFGNIWKELSKDTSQDPWKVFDKILGKQAKKDTFRFFYLASISVRLVDLGYNEIQLLKALKKGRKKLRSESRLIYLYEYIYDSNYDKAKPLLNKLRHVVENHAGVDAFELQLLLAKKPKDGYKFATKLLNRDSYHDSYLYVLFDHFLEKENFADALSVTNLLYARHDIYFDRALLKEYGGNYALFADYVPYEEWLDIHLIETIAE